MDHLKKPKKLLLKLMVDEDDGEAQAKMIENGMHWTRQEKFVWFCALFLGTTVLYASRTTMPLVAPMAAKDLQWSKTETGTVLSAFFWGYSLTQIPGGYWSDKYGAERVLFAAGLGWGLLTFWFHQLVYLFQEHSRALKFVVLVRVLLGAFQGVHFPAMASLSSRNLNQKDRSFFFSATTGGTAIGTVLTGTLGSVMYEYFRWPSVFYSIGFVGLVWVAFLKYFVIETSNNRQHVLGLSSSAPLLTKTASTEKVPWLTYLKHPALWACMVCHFCQNNCFFILLSWLPTYFHDNFPDAKGWVFNVVPWLFMIPGIYVASLISNKMLAKGVSVTRTRKLCESFAMVTEMVILLLVGLTTSFPIAIILLSIGFFSAGFHNAAVVVNPQDLAPKHSGSIFGAMNAMGAIPGKVKSYALAVMLASVGVFASGFHKLGTVVTGIDLAPKHSGCIVGIINTAGSMAGFVGVYVAGHILDLTGSWSAVFNFTAVINFIGITVFWILGSSKPIV